MYVGRSRWSRCETQMSQSVVRSHHAAQETRQLERRETEQTTRTTYESREDVVRGDSHVRRALDSVHHTTRGFPCRSRNQHVHIQVLRGAHTEQYGCERVHIRLHESSLQEGIQSHLVLSEH